VTAIKTLSLITLVCMLTLLRLPLTKLCVLFMFQTPGLVGALQLIT
jgi:hypothetical protein